MLADEPQWRATWGFLSLESGVLSERRVGPTFALNRRLTRFTTQKRERIGRALLPLWPQGHTMAFGVLVFRCHQGYGRSRKRFEEERGREKGKGRVQLIDGRP